MAILCFIFLRTIAKFSLGKSYLRKCQSNHIKITGFLFVRIYLVLVLYFVSLNTLDVYKMPFSL